MMLLALALTLPQTYDLALKRSEAVALSQELVAESEARVREIRGSVLPRVDARAQRLWQDQPNPGQAFLRPPHVTDVRLSATQPIFSGFREFLAFKASRRAKEARAEDHQRAKGLLYQDVVTAYVTLLGAQQDLQTLRETRALNADRLEDLRRRVELGKSRQTEVLAAETQLAQIEADIAAAEGDREDAQELVRFLTGLEEELELAALEAPSPEELERFLRSARTRPDVRAATLDRESAEALERVAARERWPTVSVSGNYYPYRKGQLEGMRWDAVAGVSLPLFAGGAVGARVEQAESRRRQAALRESLARRSAEREARAAHKALLAAVRRYERLERAAKLAERNAKAQAADYRLGLVTNLEVLAGLTSLSQARLSRDAARLDAVAARARLEVAAGGPTTEGSGATPKDIGRESK